MRRLTVLAAVLAAVSACASGGSSPPSLGWKIEENPFRIVLTQDGKTVVEQAPGARLRYQLKESGQQRSLTNVISKRGDTYTVGTDEPGRTATVALSRVKGAVHVRMKLQPADGVAAVYDAFRAAPTDHFLGGGENGTPLDLRGQVVPVKVSYKCTYAPAPFFISSAGYGLDLATENVAGLAFPGSTGGSGCTFGESPSCSFDPLTDRAEVCVRGAELNEDFYGGTPQEVYDARTAAVGAFKVPPLSQLALIKWRDAVGGPGELLEDIQRFQDAKIPLGWVLLDNPWERQCVGTLDWDRTRIPDPAGLAKTIHDKGVKLMLWVSPDQFCDTGYPGNVLIHDAIGSEIDFTHADAVKEFQSRLRKALSVGVDGVKGDRADEADLEGRNVGLHNRYPVLFARSVVQVLEELHGNDWASIFRAIGPGEQKIIHGVWAGDQPGDWTGFHRAIRSGASAGVAGLTVWGSDIGGYSSDLLPKEVFLRWLQFGAISPVMEIGGTGPNATPWVFGPDAMEAIRAAATLHYELVPYFHDLIKRGQAVMTPLAFGFPKDAVAWDAEYELLIGPNVLAAPVAGPGTDPSVYLPAGVWVDLYKGSAVVGPRSYIRQTPHEQFPLYVKRGAVIPYNLRTATDSWWGLNDLERKGYAGFLATNRSKLELDKLPRNVQIFVPAPKRPRFVKIGDKRIAVWQWNEGPFPGVVIRLHGPKIRGQIVLS